MVILTKLNHTTGDFTTVDVCVSVRVRVCVCVCGVVGGGMGGNDVPLSPLSTAH